MLTEHAEELVARDGLRETLGIEVVELHPERVAATMPVTPRHQQPWGYLGGGASQVWEVKIGDANEFLVVAARCTLAIVKVAYRAACTPPEQPGGTHRRAACILRKGCRCS